MICHSEMGKPKQEVPAYDIFSGAHEDGNAFWLCTIEGLWNAKMKMDRISKEHPGRYFIYCVAEQSVITTLDTTGQQAQNNVA